MNHRDDGEEGDNVGSGQTICPSFSYGRCLSVAGTLLAAALNCGCQGGAHPTDSALTALLMEEHEEFERAVEDLSPALHTDDLGVLCEAYEGHLRGKVLEARVTFGPTLYDVEVSSTGHPKMITFPVSITGWPRGTSEKGIAYLQGDDLNPWDLVLDVDTYVSETPSSSQLLVFRRIEPHWYIYYRRL